MDAGYLIVCTFETLYARFRDPSQQPHYAIPQVDVSPAQASKQYRGIDREALEAWRQVDLDLGFPGIITPDIADHEACLLMNELEQRGASEGDFIFSSDDAWSVWNRLKDQSRWELIWARHVGASVYTPPNGQSLGFEPTWFKGDHFSAVSDCMCFPKWHGTDTEGTLFLPYYRQLNQHALFDSPIAATEFLDFYRSHPWTETGDYVIAEIWSVAGIT